MCRLLIFGGTTEGRQLAQFCADHGISAWVSVASRYGRDMLPDSEYLSILASRMDWQEMAAFMRDKQVQLVVDATHPYAKEVTENVKRACAKEQIPLLRCLRDADAKSAEAEKEVFYVPTAEAAAQMLEHTEGNVFVTTGSKELRAFTALADYENRIYARVLPSLEAVEQCRELGITGRHLICMQGPFSEDLNAAIMGQINAQWMVTKETGKNGGYDEKIRAARRNGASVIVIRREKEENGLSAEEVEKRILAFSRRTEEVISLPKTNPFQVILAGIGPGSAGQMTLDVLEHLLHSRVLLGAPRMVESALKALERLEPFLIHREQNRNCRQNPPQTKPLYQPEEVIRFLEEYRGGGTVTVLFSGDTGFYSGTKKLAAELKKRGISFTILPGISSAAYLAARLGISWERAEFLTAHGRILGTEELLCHVNGLQEPRWLFILLAGTEGAGELCRRLTALGYGNLQAAVGERLSYENERIRQGTVKELSETAADSLSILAVQAEPQNLPPERQES